MFFIFNATSKAFQLKVTVINELRISNIVF
jgi:hypothetical protein